MASRDPTGQRQAAVVSGRSWGRAGLCALTAATLASPGRIRYSRIPRSACLSEIPRAVVSFLSVKMVTLYSPRYTASI